MWRMCVAVVGTARAIALNVLLERFDIHPIGGRMSTPSILLSFGVHAEGRPHSFVVCWFPSEGCQKETFADFDMLIGRMGDPP